MGYKVIIDLLGVMHQTMSAVHGNGGTRHTLWLKRSNDITAFQEGHKVTPVTSDQQEPTGAPAGVRTP